MVSENLNIIDLFCGCGGFGLGAHRAGFNSILAVDKDETLSSAYALNFPNTKLKHYDLSTVTSEQLKSDCEGKSVFGIIGGPPCQGFSSIGKRFDDDPRNELLDHYFRHIKNIKPSFFVMENVPGLINKNTNSSLQFHIDQLSEFYSIIGPIIVDVSNLGAATVRKRVLVIGVDLNKFDEISTKDIQDLYVLQKTTVRDALYDLGEPKSVSDNCFEWSKVDRRKKLSAYARKAREFPKQYLGWAHALEMLKKGYVSGFMDTKHSPTVHARYSNTKAGQIDKVSKSKKLEWGGQCPTLRAGTGSDKGSHQAVRPLHPEKGRVITVREAARLQGFPDWYVFHQTKWHSFRMIGNSVSPVLSETILGLIKSRIKSKQQSIDGLQPLLAAE